MATIPRTYLITSKEGLSSVQPKNGQVIAVYDSDEVWYDAPEDGTRDGNPVRRKISGIRVITSLPESPMEDIVYVYIGDHGTIPGSDTDLYDLRVWVNNDWIIVGSNREDKHVETTVSNGRFYLVGAPDATPEISSLLKHSSVYVQGGKIYGDLEGTASEADHAKEATLATRAVNDNAEPAKPITGYLYDVSSDATTNLGSTITFTLGNGTLKSIRTRDTVYSIYNASTAGLVNATSVHADSDSTNLILVGAGWMDKSLVSVGLADQAVKDNYGNGQNIASTYIKGLSYDQATDNLVVTKGDGTTSNVPIPTQEYEIFDVGKNGLVPGPTNADTSKYLNGSHQWVNIPNYTGATSGAAGIAGLVPPAAVGETTKYLKGDGTWGTVFAQGVAGLVPGPATADATFSLKANGTWSADIDTKNTAGSTQDANKLYLVGAKSQASSAQTFSNVKVYVDGDKLYSNNVEVVNISDVQALTNKTYNGYTLGSACAVDVDSNIDPTDAGYVGGNVPSNDAVVNYLDNAVAAAITPALEPYLPATVIAPAYDKVSTSYAADDFCTNLDPLASVQLYKCLTPISAPAGDFDDTKWTAVTLIDVIESL